MNLRCLPSLALTILAFSIFTHAQSLGDLARQLRIEREQNGVPHTRVITNDDIASRAPAKKASRHAVQNHPADEDKETAKAADSTEVASNAEADTTPQAAKKDAAKEVEARKRETDRRTAEINQVYLDRIADIRAKINTTQQELAKIQQEQTTDTFDFKRTLGTIPSSMAYEEHRRVFIEQIKAQNDLIVSLNSQLEDAQEAARHAGVPHATD